VVRAGAGGLLVDGQLFAPLLEIFLQEPDGIPAGIVLVDDILHDTQDKERYVVEPDLAIQGADERLERPAANPLAIGLLLPDRLRDEPGKYRLVVPAERVSSARFETTLASIQVISPSSRRVSRREKRDWAMIRFRTRSPRNS